MLKKDPRFVALVALLLTGCAGVNEEFDSVPGKGLGNKSITEVNALLDKREDKSTEAVAPVISGGLVQKEHSMILLSDNSVLEREPEKHVRVWVAPFQDQEGNFHEGSFIHVLTRKSHWQLHNYGVNS